VLFGFPLDEQQRELFRQCTGREHINSEGHHEAWMVIGRRGGKSFALALIAVFLAFRWSHLSSSAFSKLKPPPPQGSTAD
jgi:hypothetical protein